MNVFDLRNRIVSQYSDYIHSYISISDERIRQVVEGELESGFLWPEPLVQLSPSFAPGASIDDLVNEGILHPSCRMIFRARKTETHLEGYPLRLHKHQEEAVRMAADGYSYVLTTGTGSGKSLAYIIPIVNDILRSQSGQGIRAIVVYPMNALANSQLGELRKFLCQGFPEGQSPVRFERYTGEETDEDKRRIMANPPDILLTNYVMLEYILTRPSERTTLVQAAQGLRFLVLDELHTYRGRQGGDVALLVRRLRNLLKTQNLQCVGTSATISSGENVKEQKRQVSQVALRLFGVAVPPERVIGETLRRITPEREIEHTDFLSEMKSAFTKDPWSPPLAYEEFIKHPFSSWIESTLGVNKEDTGHLVRATPRRIAGPDGIGSALASLTGLPLELCTQAITKWLLVGFGLVDPETGGSPFAFRIHQFISKGEKVYVSLENEDSRYITLHGQLFVPGDRSKVLFPIAFCRECGQEYYSVWKVSESAVEEESFVPRSPYETDDINGREPCYLYVSNENSWPEDPENKVDRLPQDWIEDTGRGILVRKDRKKSVPQNAYLGPDGKISLNGLRCCVIPAPFHFCLKCGVSYSWREKRDFGKLSILSSEGRSTATTILSLATLDGLTLAETPKESRKILSFTDNRQDASLQAGHLNDFVEVNTLRTALYKSVLKAGSEGLGHEDLTLRVFEALSLPMEDYAIDPSVRFQARSNTETAFRQVLGYRLYRDLRRGWRITAPNLEQCGLLTIVYPALKEVCDAEDLWKDAHLLLSSSTAENRERVATVLLDFMRRELAIHVDYLTREKQESLRQMSSQYLKDPWSIDEKEKMEFASVLFPKSKQRGEDWGGHIFLSPRSGYGQYLRRTTTFPQSHHHLDMQETGQIICQLLEKLSIGGLVRVVNDPDVEGIPGYQIPAACFRWCPGDGSKSFHDPIRVPNPSSSGGRTNDFFNSLFTEPRSWLGSIRAREHTAQVSYEQRMSREADFRDGKLPILFCSPTMELGVDIAQLNTVNLRNIPPTPANYAQRSGRAGRSGQPALITSYCSSLSAHDQFFFKRPDLMVSGAVQPPRIDLANQDLVRAHIHSVWLAEVGISLGTSLVDILDVAGEKPSLILSESIRQQISDPKAKTRTLQRSKALLSTIHEDLDTADWYREGWLEEVLSRVEEDFDRACDRWRSLYRSAMEQHERQNRIIADASVSVNEKDTAKRIRHQAESQLELLTQSENVFQSDFYSYRYFATEGFLPGYNFPRLPLSAFIPGRNRYKSRDEFLSRPRFLAISEFGPSSIVYHEGAKYVINQVILPPDDRDLQTSSAKICPQCGYLHLADHDRGPDRCDFCNSLLGEPLRELFRLQNVSTRRRDRITSDEEERTRMGYEIGSGIRFGDRGERPPFRSGIVESSGNCVAELTYGNAATIWRINRGWKNRKIKEQFGFVLDLQRGYWSKDQQIEDDDDTDTDPISADRRRVIPYVEDHKNCLLLRPSVAYPIPVMASLQAALKRAIELEFQLEESELAAEPLPNGGCRNLLLFYEAAEGGAGVLGRLLEDPDAIRRVIHRALEICHYDPITMEDQRHHPRAKEDCEAACYDCLLSYSNQADHPLLDRKKVFEVLSNWSQARVSLSPVEAPRSEHLTHLRNSSSSELEREWIDFLEERNLRLPDKAQQLIEKCKTRPDFLYSEIRAAVYIDGPHHLYADRHQRDIKQTECLEDAGYTVIRFGLKDDWDGIISRYPDVFGGHK